MYINGIQQTSYTGSINSTPILSALVFASVSGHRLNGSIDEVRIYNRALTTGEISTLYAQDAP